jgi:hypothetical protein
VRQHCHNDNQYDFLHIEAPEQWSATIIIGSHGELMSLLCRHCNLHKRGRGSKGELCGTGKGIERLFTIGAYQQAEDDLHRGY